MPGRSPINPRHVKTVADARAIVLERLLTSLVGNGGVNVHIEVDPSLAIVADPLVIERVMTNLVTNALVHGAPPVRIRADLRDRHLRISVADRGAGVPEELVPDDEVPPPPLLHAARGAPVAVTRRSVAASLQTRIFGSSGGHGRAC